MIPKILHSVWIGNGNPRLDYREQWKEVHPDWDIQHWTDERINKEFNIDLDISGPTMVSDYVRLLILNKYGGVYSDCDVMFLKSLNDFLHHKAFFTYQLPPIKNPKKVTPRGLKLKDCVKNKINIFDFYNEDIYCNNNLIGSEPNGKAIRRFIELFETDKSLPESQRFSYIDYGSGPSMCTFLCNTFVKVDGYTQHCEELSLYESEVFHPTNYTQYPKQVIARNFESVIDEQIQIAKEKNSYAVHFQTSTEVKDYR